MSVSEKFGRSLRAAALENFNRAPMPCYRPSTFAAFVQVVGILAGVAALVSVLR